MHKGVVMPRNLTDGPFDDAGVQYQISPDYAQDYKAGDGSPSCPHCRGRGVLNVPVKIGPPAVKPCSCVRARDVVFNMERGWKGLSKADVVDESPLVEYVDQNLWLTCGNRLFKAYMRYIARIKGANWDFRVVSDHDLMNSWLATAKLQSKKIYDRDVARSGIPDEITLEDLVAPYPFLVILCGIKSARNEAMPGVFLEAILQRYHVSKPTWIVDQPYLPLRDGHRCWSRELQLFLDHEWDHTRLDLSPDVIKTLPPPVSKGRQALPGRKPQKALTHGCAVPYLNDDWK